MWNRLARNTVSALAVAVAVLSATPARADRDDHEEWREGWRRAAPVAPAPVPVVVLPSPYRPSPPAYAPAPPMAPSWRFAHWRSERRDELRHEYRELELARGRFYRSWDGRPWTRDRFERWYAGRHAELDTRAAELERGWR